MISELVPAVAALKLVLASAAVVAPVPPYNTAIGVPFQVPEVTVPKPVREELTTVDPKVVESNTLAPPILKVFPEPALISPLTSNLYNGFTVPTPTLPENSAIPTVPSASILKDGIPDISLTENIVPVVTELETEKSCPVEPSKEIVLSSKT